MEKLLALCLVLSALLTASHCTQSKGVVIVKDGHRVVVVEYDGDGKTNTRVLISPPEEVEKRNDKEGQVFGNAKKKVKETESSLPGEEERDHHASPGKILCDAIGKWKDKMATMLGRVNDTTPETQSESVAGKAHEAKETMKEKAIKKAHKAQNVSKKVKIAVREIGTAVAAALKLTKIGSVVGLIGIGAAYGMCVWVTLGSRHVLASVLGRQQLGVVQSKIYLVYFKAISVGILVGLLGHVISRQRKVLTDAVEMWQVVNLLSSILLVEANASFVEPRVTKAMYERIKAEKEDGRGSDTSESQSIDAVKKLSERLSRLNAYSSRLNLLTLMSLSWHFVYLGHRLTLTC